MGVYYAKLVLSESLHYSKHSIEYILMTPEVFKHLPVEEIGKVKEYYYSAADGNKPVINALELESDKTVNAIDATLADYFSKNNYTSSSKNTFSKDKQEISISIEKSQSNTLTVNITLLELIN